MKLLFVVPQMTTGGAEQVVYDLCSGLLHRGHGIGLASAGGHLADELAKVGVHIVTVRGLDRRWPMGMARAAFRLARVLRQDTYDLVNAHSLTTSLISFMALRLTRSRARHVFTLHLPEKLWYYRVMGRTLGWTVDQVVTVCRDNRTRLVNSGVDENRIRVIYNGVDVDRFSPEPREKGENRFRIGILGRLIERKGHADLLQALSSLVGGMVPTDVYLDIIGDGPMRDDLKQLTLDLGLKENVSFLGDRRDVPALLQELDVLAMPSTYEAFPVAILEALSSGLPVVATAVNGITEVIKHGETGFLVQPHDIEGLAQALATVAQSPDLRRHLSLNGVREVKERFSIRQMLDAYEETFQTLTSGSVLSLGATAKEE